MKSKNWIIFFAVLIGIVLFHLLMAPVEEGNLIFSIISDLIIVISAGMAVYFGIKAAKKTGVQTPQGKAFLYLSAGIFLWFIAEIIWFIYDIAIDSFPLVSPADIFWIMGYPLMFMGLFVALKAIKRIIKKDTIIISLVIFASILAIISIYIIYPVLTYEEYSFAEKVVTIVYPIGDLIVLLGAILITVSMIGGVIVKPWLYITWGIIMYVISDSVYSYVTWNEAYYILTSASQWISGFIDITYYLSYILMAVGFYEQIALLTPKKKKR